MSLNDAAVVYPNTAYFFYATSPATKPTVGDITTFLADTSQTPSGWTQLGHTSIDQVMAFGQDGGDSQVIGTMQSKALMEIITDEAIDYFTVVSNQFKDNEVLRLYYGGGDASVANEFSIPDTATPQTQALFVVVSPNTATGTTPFGLYVPKVSVRRDDAIEMPSDDFTKVPLRFTVLKLAGYKKLTWIGSGLGAVATPAPTLTALSPSSTGVAGGAVIVISGTDLAGATDVKVAATSVGAGKWVATSNTRVTFVAPAKTAGQYDVTVVTPAGTTATGAASQLTYA